MSRAINSTTKAALATGGFNLCTLVQMDFPTVIRITDYDRSISAMSQTFTSSPHLLSIGGVTESTELRINSMTIELSGAEQTYLAILLGGDYIDVWVSIYRAVLDSSDAVVGAPWMYFKGLIAGFSFDEQESTSVISLDIASHWKDFEKESGRKSNHNSHQVYFPGDLGLEYGARIIKDIKWGRK